MKPRKLNNLSMSAANASFVLHRSDCVVRRGMALLMVVTVLGVVAIVGFALLSAASLQAQAAANSTHSAEAASLAESGMELACYYLLYPSKAPTAIPAGSYWTGATGIHFGSTVGGTADVTVSSLGGIRYQIVSVGRATVGAAPRTVTAVVEVNPGFVTRQSAGFAGNAFLSTNTVVNHDVQVNGTINNKGTIKGKLISPNAPGGTGTIQGGWVTPSSTNSTQIPAWSAVRDYTTYTYGGKSYSAKVITTLAAGTILGPTDDNPAGVFVCHQATGLTVASDVKVHGTLVVDGGPLNVNGTRSDITPLAGFPAAVAKFDVYIKGNGTARDMTFNGTTWVGGAIKSSGTVLPGNNKLIFNGSVLFGGTGSVDATFAGAITINWDSTLTSGVELDKTITPAGVKVVSFK